MKEGMVLKRLSKPVLRWVVLGSACGYVLFAQGNAGYNTTVPSSIMDQFRNQRINWAANVWVYANALFGLLAIIEFAWSAAVMLLEKSDLQSWTSALIRKMMWLGAFYAVLLYGNSWIAAIIDSFTAIGQNASGVIALSPGDVFAQGLQIAAALLGGASTSAFFTNPGPSLALVFCALLIFISYVIITINFIVTMVESYILVSVGFVFLGFGGSRWTAPYVERFIGLAVSIGIKILLLYCLIAAGMNLGVNWIDEAQSVSASARPLMTAFDVMGAAVIFMMLCWQIPKLFAGVLGGAPTLTGGDFAATVGAIASAGLAAGSTLGAGAAMLAGGGMLASRAGGASADAGSSPPPGASSAVAGVGAAKAPSGGTAAVAPPSSPSGSAAGSSAITRGQPDPPSSRVSSQTSAIAAIGGQPLAGSGFENERVAKGFRPTTAPVSSPDSATPIEEASCEESGGAAATGASPGASALVSLHSGSASVSAPAPRSRWTGMASTAQRAQRILTRAAFQIHAMRRRIPADAAPATTPPRMPIDHHED
jgi:type IV secretion system protein TrbL